MTQLETALAAVGAVIAAGIAVFIVAALLKSSAAGAGAGAGASAASGAGAFVRRNPAVNTSTSANSAYVESDYVRRGLKSTYHSWPYQLQPASSIHSVNGSIRGLQPRRMTGPFSGLPFDVQQQHQRPAHIHKSLTNQFPVRQFLHIT